MRKKQNMKIAVIEKEHIVVKNTDKITLDDRKGAIVKVLGCGLCGSDIVKFREHISKDGTVLGHEIVAEIVEINSDTKFKTGEKIITSHHIPCGTCDYCRHGNVSMCKHFKSTNIRPGGFSEYVYLSEEHLQNVAHPMPKNLSEIEASFYEPLGCCVRAVKRAKLMDGSKVLVVGLGSIGILMSQALKAYGMNVMGCDLIQDRIERLQNLGIDAVDSRDLEQAELFDAVFMTSGADKAIDVALKTIKSGGTILVFSSTPHNTGYPNNEIYYRELTVLGSYSPAPVDLKDSLELLRTGKVNVKDLSTIYSLDDIQKAFDDTIANRIMKAYIKIKD